MPTLKALEDLINRKKIVTENIVWCEQNKLFLGFTVETIAREEFLTFNGTYNRERNCITSLALVYRRIFPLVRIDKSKHTNPPGTNELTFTDWHKHRYNELWEDHLAIDVTHEFNDNMTPKEIISQFMIENNMSFSKGKRYQTNLDDFYIKIKTSES